MSEGPTVWDGGLQAERTALSWRRTSLAVVVGAALVTRISVTTLGRPGLACAGLVLLLALGAATLGVRRYDCTLEHLARRGTAADMGRAAALVSAAVAGVGALVIAVAVARIVAESHT